MVVQLKDKQEWRDCHSKAGEKIVIVDFTASWCGPCQHIKPEFERLAAEYPDIVFVKVDVDENEEVAAECGIRAMPTFQVFKKGEKVEEFCGASVEKLEALVKKYA